MYLNEKLSARSIGEIFDLPHSTILRWIKQEGIPRRDRSWRCKETGFKKGFTPWNKGLFIQTNTGRTHIKKGERRGTATEFKNGNIPWNEGLPIQTNTGKTHFKKGIHSSPETEFQNLTKERHLELAKKGFQKSVKRPTGPERKMIYLIEKHGLPLKYVGNGTFWVGRKNPDFVHTSEKLIIEIFGRYWHDEKEIEPRTKYFQNHGYECIIFWEDEVEDVLSLFKDSGDSAWARMVV